MQSALTIPCHMYVFLISYSFYMYAWMLQPYGFDVGQSERGSVLKGLDLGVKGMKVGGQVRSVFSNKIYLLYLEALLLHNLCLQFEEENWSLFLWCFVVSLEWNSVLESGWIYVETKNNFVSSI